MAVLFNSYGNLFITKLFQRRFLDNVFSKVRCMHADNEMGIDIELCKGQGSRVWDKDGKEYLDFIAGKGSLIAGHCHPKLTSVICEQIQTLHMTSRFLDNAPLCEFSANLAQLFNYDKVLVLNTGTEASETAIKLARIWGYKVKKICPKEAVIVFPQGNYLGFTMGAISASSEPLMFNGFQPLLKGLRLIPFNDVCSLEEALKNPNVCAFMTEPIQVIPGMLQAAEGYLTEVRRLCTQYKVLWIGNEILTGMGRTGAMLASDHECVKPDILVVGKALGGGFAPVAAVLASCEVMDLLQRGSHVSTYGGYPAGARLGLQVLRTIKEECLVDNALTMGNLLRDGLLCSLDKNDMPVLRAKGLLLAMKIDPRIATPMEIIEECARCGLLVWPTCDEFIRMTPPLTVTEEEVTQAVGICKKVVDFMKKLDNA